MLWSLGIYNTDPYLGTMLRSHLGLIRGGYRILKGGLGYTNTCYVLNCATFVGTGGTVVSLFMKFETKVTRLDPALIWSLIP